MSSVNGEGTIGPDGASEDRREHGPSRRLGTTRARRSLAAQHANQRSRIEVIADQLTRVAASTPFLLAHVLWFAFWMLANTGFMGIHPFDPFPFGLLTMVVSLEAIFLSIFVLMAQSRESAVAELREEVSLQVVLRMEEEVTKTLSSSPASTHALATRSAWTTTFARCSARSTREDRAGSHRRDRTGETARQESERDPPLCVTKPREAARESASRGFALPTAATARR
jgi:uncharacterized membrane protein